MSIIVFFAIFFYEQWFHNHAGCLDQTFPLQKVDSWEI